MASGGVAAGGAPVAGHLKIAVLGSRGVGKTSFIEHLVGRELSAVYSPTEGTATTEATVHTNRGEFSIEFLELTPPVGEDVELTVDQEALAGSAAAILMFDVTSRLSYKNSPVWHKHVLTACEDIPMVFVGNKVDVQERKVMPKHINFHRKKDLQYYDVSVKSVYNMHKPLQWLLAKHMGDVDLQLASVGPISQGLAASVEADSDVED